MACCPRMVSFGVRDIDDAIRFSMQKDYPFPVSSQLLLMVEQSRDLVLDVLGRELECGKIRAIHEPFVRVGDATFDDQAGEIRMTAGEFDRVERSNRSPK